MNPRHSMQGRRFLFKEMGRMPRGQFYWWAYTLGVVWWAPFLVGRIIGTKLYEKPKTYITQEEFWRHQYEAQVKKSEKERERLIELRSKTRLTEEDVRAMLQICWRESRLYPGMKSPSSTSHGLFGFLRSTCKAYGPCEDDPIRQTQMAIAYVNDRYGSPQRALAFHRQNGWY